MAKQIWLKFDDPDNIKKNSIENSTWADFNTEVMGTIEPNETFYGFPVLKMKNTDGILFKGMPGDSTSTISFWCKIYDYSSLYYIVSTKHGLGESLFVNHSGQIINGIKGNVITEEMGWVNVVWVLDHYTNFIWVNGAYIGRLGSSYYSSRFYIGRDWLYMESATQPMYIADVEAYDEVLFRPETDPTIKLQLPVNVSNLYTNGKAMYGIKKK